MTASLVVERDLDQLDMQVLRAVWVIKRDADMLRRRIAVWEPAEMPEGWR